MKDLPPKLAAIINRLLRAIEGIEKAVQGQADTASSAHERQGSDDKPQERRVTVGFTDHVIQDTKTEQDRQYGIQKSIRNTARAAVVAAVIYAGIAAYQAHEMRQATNLTESQWKSQQVPWLGLESNAVSISPGMEFAWSPALAYPTVYVGPVNYVIKNFGPAPAFHEWDSIYVWPNTDGQKPAKLLEVVCQMREGIGKGHAETSDGDVILPGVQIPVSRTTNILTIPPKHLESIWLIACISYEDSWKRVHHSRYLYMSVPGPGFGIPPTTPSPAHPDWTYIPIKGVYLDGAQAD